MMRLQPAVVWRLSARDFYGALELARGWTPRPYRMTVPLPTAPDLLDDVWLPQRWHERMAGTLWEKPTQQEIDRACGPMYRMHAEVV